MFNVNSIKELQEAVLKLVHPETGALLPAEITLAGANHPKRKAIEFQRARQLRAKVAKKGRLELTDPQDDADYEIDRLVACTLSWKGVARDDVALECNATEVRALYESNAWIRNQALEFMGDAAGFLQSAKSPLLSA